MIRRQKAIAFLKKRAILAYQSGDIGTVRHLSGIALEKVLEDGREGLEFKDILWAFIFMIFYSKNNWESFVIIDKAYETFGSDEKDITNDGSFAMHKTVKPKRPTTDISPYVPLLNFIFDILKPDWTHLEDHYNAISIINISEIPDDYNDVSSELLLTKVIEFWWYIDNESGKWELLSDKWKQELSHASKRYKLIDQLWSRLKIQNYLLYNFEQEETLQLIKKSFLQRDSLADCLMAHAWFYVYQEDWSKLDDLFLKMKKNIPFESEYALSFQGLINSTRVIRRDVRNTHYRRTQSGIYETNEHLQSAQGDYFEEPQNNVPDDDSTDIAGILRYQRIQLTRPTALFYFQWRANFDEMIIELKKKPHGQASKRANMMAIAMLLELEALRLWDLGMYQGAIKRRCEISLDFGMYYDQQGKYSGRVSSLRDALIFALRSSDDKIDEGGEMTKAENLVEVFPDGENYITEVIKAAIKTSPMQYSSTLVMLKILEDAIPPAHLVELAQWSVKMFHQYQLNSAHFNLKCFNFWATIFEYNTVPEEAWAVLEQVLHVLFQRPIYWSTSDELLKVALCKAPIEQAKQWAESMEKIEIGDDNTDRYRYQILFNSAIQIEELKDIVDKYLYRRIEEKKNLPEMVFWKYEQQLLHSSNELPLGIEEIQLHLIGKLELRCRAIKATTSGYRFYGSINWDFARVDWSTCSNERLSGVIQLIEDTIYQSSNVTSSDVRDLLLVLANMVRTAPSEFVGNVAKLAHKVIDQPPKAFDNFFNGGPLSNFSMTKDVIDEIKYAVIRMVTRLYRVVEEQERVFFQRWSLSECFATEPLNLGFLSSLFFYVYLLGHDNDIKEQALNGFQIIYSRVQQGEGLAYVLGSLSAVLQDERIKNSNKQPLILKDSPALLESFKRFIQISYNYPDPEVRVGSALLVKEIIIAGGDVDVKIKAQLKRDVRARVRKVFDE